jgi:hypothetical protein
MCSVAILKGQCKQVDGLLLQIKQSCLFPAEWDR